MLNEARNFPCLDWSAARTLLEALTHKHLRQSKQSFKRSQISSSFSLPVRV